METIRHLRMNGKLKGFTLVELIVVITILVILGTIAFINLGGFAGSARDSARVSDMKSIETGLALYNVKSGSYPDPETPVSIEASGTQIGLQGYLGDTIGSLIKMSPTPVDPLDKSKYVYSVNTTRTKYQVMGFLEENNSIAMEGNTLIDTAYAADLSKRFPKVGGDSLGILLDSGTLAPVSGTKIDLITTNSGSIYNAYFGNTASDIITTTGTGIFSGMYNRQPELIKNKALASMDSSLVGYWDMETLTGTMLKDLSGKGNDGTFSGTTNVSGRVGNARSFNGTSDSIDITSVPASLNITNAHSILAWIKTSAYTFQCIACISKVNTLSSFSYALDISGSGFIRGIVANGSNGTNRISNILVNDGVWHFVAYIYNPSTLSLDVYIDGQLNNGVLTGIVPSSINIPSVPFAIGTKQAQGSTARDHFFNGFIDEVRIYNRALSDSEIQNLYNATK